MVDAEGKGIEWVDVAAEVRQTRGRGRFSFRFQNSRFGAAHQTQSGPRGAFSLRVPGGSAYLLKFAKKGYGPAELEIAPLEKRERRDDLVVELAPGAVVVGRVADPEGMPVQGAEVRVVENLGFSPPGAMLARFASQLPMRARSDATGRFEIGSLQPETSVDLVVDREGFVAAVVPGVETGGGEMVEVVLQPAGRPAIGARVSIFDPGGGRFSFGGEMAFTDGDGHYRLDGVEPGRHGVEAELDGYRRAAHDFAVEPGINRLDLRLGGGVEASGWVVDERGAAVAGAGVYLRGDGIGSSSFTATSGADGRFTITDVSPGDYRLGAHKDGYADVLADDLVNVRGEAVTGLEVVLGRGATLTGQITGLELDELSRLRLRVFSDKGMREGEVDYDGLYRVANLAPGEWRVLAQVDDGGRQVSGEVVIEEAQFEARLDLDFGRGYVVEGVALLNGTSPIVGARISLSRLGGGYAGSAQTRHDGGFRIEDVEAGSYRLNLREIGGLSHTEEIEIEGDTEVRLDVVTAEVSGFVRDALDRVPLEGVAVSLEALGGDSTGRRWPATSDSRGYFSLGEVGAGEYRLRAEKSGYAPSSRELSLNPEAPEELELSPTEGIRFEVALSSGITPDSVQAVVLSGGEKVVGGVYPTLQGGLVRLAKVPEGTWELVLSAGASAVESRIFTAPGHLGRIVLGPGGELEVTVPELAEENVSASLTLVGPGGRPHRVPIWGGEVRSEFSFSRGKGRVPSLAVGLWQAEVRAADGRVWTGSVNVAPGDGNLLVLQ